MALFIKSLKSIVKKNGNNIFLIPLPPFGIFTLYLFSINLNTCRTMATKRKTDLFTAVKMILRGYDHSHIPIDKFLQPYENDLFPVTAKRSFYLFHLIYENIKKSRDFPQNSNLQTLISKL